ncbi:MAG: LiaI-LiaF-like domain-containing protein [Bryobacteraceae bacterium]
MNSARAFFRAIRGPILLITLGSLFAIDHFGPYSFTRTWPVLLIVAGAMCLFERLATDAEGPGVRPGGTV